MYAHPLFLDQLQRLISAVERDKEKNPDTYKTKANAKLLAALARIAFYQIPQDPTLDIYRQGKTLGDAYTHWFRAKFGNGRFRLFFRYMQKNGLKVIIFSWVNDSETLRTRGAKSDAYAVFKRMLDDGNPPDSWDVLFAACKADENIERLANLTDGLHSHDESRKTGA